MDGVADEVGAHATHDVIGDVLIVLAAIEPDVRCGAATSKLKGLLHYIDELAIGADMLARMSFIHLCWFDANTPGSN